MFGVRCMLYDVCCPFVFCLSCADLCVVCVVCLMFVACCVLRVVCCLLVVVCGSSCVVVCWLLFYDRGVLFFLLFVDC